MKLLVFYFVGVKGDHISLYEITSLLILGGSAISSRLIVSKHQDQREASRLTTCQCRTFCSCSSWWCFENLCGRLSRPYWLSPKWILASFLCFHPFPVNQPGISTLVVPKCLSLPKWLQSKFAFDLRRYPCSWFLTNSPEYISWMSVWHLSDSSRDLFSLFVVSHSLSILVIITRLLKSIGMQILLCNLFLKGLHQLTSDNLPSGFLV